MSSFAPPIPANDQQPAELVDLLRKYHIWQAKILFQRGELPTDHPSKDELVANFLAKHASFETTKETDDKVKHFKAGHGQDSKDWGLVVNILPEPYEPCVKSVEGEGGLKPLVGGVGLLFL